MNSKNVLICVAIVIALVLLAKVVPFTSDWYLKGKIWVGQKLGLKNYKLGQ